MTYSLWQHVRVNLASCGSTIWRLALIRSPSNAARFHSSEFLYFSNIRLLIIVMTNWNDFSIINRLFVYFLLHFDSFLHIKIDDDKFDSDLIQRCQTTKLQIVIVCPLLISLEHSYIKKKLSHIIRAERTIGLLLDVKEIQMIDIHRGSKLLELKHIIIIKEFLCRKWETLDLRRIRRKWRKNKF